MDVEDYLPISGLQHLMFCERQCALIHVEQAWSENILTAEGRVLHESAHTPGVENRPGVKISRSLRICSHKLRLVGVADIVEFYKNSGKPDTPYPVEYKRGRRGNWRHDAVQLCAQAIALEEMLNQPVNEGAIYYHKTRRRRIVEMDADLRQITEKAAERFHEIVRCGITPPPTLGKWCKNCSLESVCMPNTIGKSDPTRYLNKIIRESPNDEIS